MSAGNDPRTSRQRRRRPGAILAAALLSTALAACGDPGPAGPATPEAAITAYITALNTRDGQALHRLAGVENPQLAEAVEIKLKAAGGRNVTVEEQRVESPVPHIAVGHVDGTMDSAPPGGPRQPYTERLSLNRDDEGRWSVDVVRAAGFPPTPDPGPLPTADPGRPGS